MQIVIHTREAANERPHVHIVKRGKPSERDPKVWLDTLEMDNGLKGKDFSKSDLRVAHEMVKRLQDMCLKDWVKIDKQPARRHSKASKKKSNKNKA